MLSRPRRRVRRCAPVSQTCANVRSSSSPRFAVHGFALRSLDASTVAGAAYVFVRSGTTWAQQAYLKAANAGVSDNFGSSVAVSDDIIVVGAPGESGDATSTMSASNDNASGAGAAYVFVRSGTTWAQQAY